MSIERNREFMKRESAANRTEQSDRQKGIPAPPVSKAVRGNLVTLPSFEGVTTENCYDKMLDIRRSVRVYDDAPMSGQQLAFVLYSAMAIQALRGEGTLRPAATGSARCPFELYVTVRNVTGLAPGVYRYAPLENVGNKVVALEFLGDIDDYDTTLAEMCGGQKWAVGAACTLFFSFVPYLTEWSTQRWGHRSALIGLGHIGQNVMLSAVALGLGSCCMAVYDQARCDGVLGLDGEEEHTAYAVAVGVPKQQI